MILKVFWTEEANETFENIVSYLEKEWGENAVKKFVQKTNKTLLNIVQQPFIFKPSNINENIRKGLITKNCSVFYEVQEEQIRLLFFWDNRQEPLL
ncbi:MAG TPA: type II toxin-antitoxin system RelE/ParE family toxin [Daejeonella sp.]|nr:type II toxin-antitoxin system RelE/ParE family toxin [Daejeonella sp.]